MDWSGCRCAEQAGVRPALIIQNDVGNQFSPTTIVVAISTSRGGAYPFQVSIGSQESGLPIDSIVKCEQIRTIDQSRVGRLLGQLGSQKLEEVDVALHRSLGLECYELEDRLHTAPKCLGSC